jgi:putative toxin-antitoxin system antitoxin component (TIGR02293 family)
MEVEKNIPVARFIPSTPRRKTTRVVKALGIASFEISSLMNAARRGLSWAAIRRFLNSTGFSQQDLAHYLDIPERTFARRREAGGFGSRESEQLLRLAEIYQAALDLFDGDAKSTLAWLTSAVRGLGNARPIDMARSEFGAREVRDMIGRLQDGVFS